MDRIDRPSEDGRIDTANVISQRTMTIPIEGGGGDGDYQRDDRTYLLTITEVVVLENGRVNAYYNYRMVCPRCEDFAKRENLTEGPDAIPYYVVRGPYVNAHGLTVVADWTLSHMLSCVA
ncbi:MAG TPA: hypothetical protein VLF67_03680 [Candidatus Saccharimonas sp.]|nr:hypothetical protein [Candidatus Saccharimonas sp.]